MFCAAAAARSTFRSLAKERSTLFKYPWNSSNASVRSKTSPEVASGSFSSWSLSWQRHEVYFFPMLFLISVAVLFRWFTHIPCLVLVRAVDLLLSRGEK